MDKYRKNIQDILKKKISAEKKKGYLARLYQEFVTESETTEKLAEMFSYVGYYSDVPEGYVESLDEKIVDLERASKWLMDSFRALDKKNITKLC